MDWMAVMDGDDDDVFCCFFSRDHGRCSCDDRIGHFGTVAVDCARAPAHMHTHARTLPPCAPQQAFRVFLYLCLSLPLSLPPAAQNSSAVITKPKPRVPLCFVYHGGQRKSSRACVPLTARSKYNKGRKKPPSLRRSVVSSCTLARLLRMPLLYITSVRAH